MGSSRHIDSIGTDTVNKFTNLSSNVIDQVLNDSDVKFVQMDPEKAVHQTYSESPHNPSLNEIKDFSNRTSISSSSQGTTTSSTPSTIEVHPEASSTFLTFRSSESTSTSSIPETETNVAAPTETLIDVNELEDKVTEVRPSDKDMDPVALSPYVQEKPKLIPEESVTNVVSQVINSVGTLSHETHSSESNNPTPVSVIQDSNPTKTIFMESVTNLPTEDHEDITINPIVSTPTQSKTESPFSPLPFTQGIEATTLSHNSHFESSVLYSLSTSSKTSTLHASETPAIPTSTLQSAVSISVSEEPPMEFASTSAKLQSSETFKLTESFTPSPLSYLPTTSTALMASSFIVSTSMVPIETEESMTIVGVVNVTNVNPNEAVGEGDNGMIETTFGEVADEVIDAEVSETPLLMTMSTTTKDRNEFIFLEKERTIIDESILFSLDNNGVVIEEDVSNFLPENFSPRKDPIETSERNRNPLTLSFENLARKYEDRQQARQEQLTEEKNIEPQIEMTNEEKANEVILEDKISYKSNFKEISTDPTTPANINKKNIDENESLLKTIVSFDFKKAKDVIASRYKTDGQRVPDLEKSFFHTPPDLSKTTSNIGVAGFGKISTTTLDPIAEVLANVEIVDISNYIPKDYKYSPNLVKEDMMNFFSEEAENINELLEDEEFKQENIKRKAKQLIDLDELAQPTVPSFKPGKLNGRLLAQMTKDIKAQETKKAEEDLYFLTFGGSRPKPEVTTESKYGWKKVEEKEDEKEFSFDAASLFESILGGSSSGKEKISTQRPTASRPLTGPSRKRTSTTSTTARPRSTTLGLCGSFCSLYANIFISSGLDWSEELRFQTTDTFKRQKEQLDQDCSNVFQQVYFGSAFEFCSVEAFSQSASGVVVDVNLQFSGIIFNVTSKDVHQSFVENLKIVDDRSMMGVYGVDVDACFFLVVDTEILNEADNLVFTKYGVELPDWAWLVMIGSVISILLIGCLWISIAVSRSRHNAAVMRRIINAKSLGDLHRRSSRVFDKVGTDSSIAYEKDRRDIWTLQRALAKESKEKHDSMILGNRADSGRGSWGSGPFRVFDRFPSLRGAALPRRPKPHYQKQAPMDLGISVNDSHAGLLGGLDNTGFNSTGFDNIGYEEGDVDFDTSYENDDTDNREDLLDDPIDDREDILMDNDNANPNISRDLLLKSFGEEVSNKRYAEKLI